jgi:hypothetical protein
LGAGIAGHAAAVAQLLESTAAAPIAVKDVLLPSKAEKWRLVQFLWEGGVLCTSSSVTPSPKVMTPAKPTGVVKSKAGNGKRKDDNGKKPPSKRTA